MRINTSSITKRMRTQALTLATTALLAGGVGMAQTNTPSQPNSTTTPMNGTTNSATHGNMDGSMNGGAPTNGASSSMGGSTSATGSMQDKKFAKTAIAGGLAEIQTAQLALQKSNSDDVKKFAQQMIDDHTKLNNQMMPIATQLGVQPPTAPMPHDQAVATKLQGLSGDAFDKAYIKAEVKDHMKDNKEFEKEASSGQNSQEKDAAQQGDTIIKQHLQMAQDLAKAHNVTVGSKSAM